MDKYTVHFDCKHRFGQIRVEANNFEEAKLKAEPLVKNGKWCYNRCDKCKLKLTK